MHCSCKKSKEPLVVFGEMVLSEKRERGDERERGFRVGRGGFPPPPSSASTGYKVVACSKLGHFVVETSSRYNQETKRQEKKQRGLYSPVSLLWDEGTKSGDTPVYRFGTMLSVRGAVILALMLLFLAEYLEAMPAIDKDKLLNNMNLVNDDGSIETALINYLFTKQIVKRLRNQLDFGDLQQKRGFWKQCATNAVACFGK